ncbi:MAG: hypothetical protein A2W33_04300 [Chloroflexi bacterium RBG_16_52_11]|nr:MAG: hypothetical protein A2W33_04300 [Chloroflexi bacterium RBG_16_52_11]
MESKDKDMDSKVMEKRRFKFGSFIKGILVGSIIAGGIALFTAPHSGAETRQILREKGEHLRDTTVQTIDNTREQINTAISSARQRADQIVKQV